MNKYLVFYFLFLLSCSGPAENNSEITDETDSINGNGLVEYDLDEDRLSAVDFNNELSLIMSLCIDAVDMVFQSDSSNIEQNVDNALFDLDVQKNKLGDIDGPKGGDDFINALRDLTDFYIKELNGGFQEIIPLIQKPKLSISEENTLEVYDQGFADTEEELIKIVYEKQDTFALNNNIKLTDQ